MASYPDRIVPADTLANGDEEVIQELRPFVGRCLNLNHDLNNPLTGIIGYAEFILKDCPRVDSEVREYVEQIMECAERIQNSVARLSDEKDVLSRRVDLREFELRRARNSSGSD